MEGNNIVLAHLKIDFTYGRSILSGMLEEMRGRPGLRLQLVRSGKELETVLKTERSFLGIAGMIWNDSILRRMRIACAEVVSFANQPPYPADRHILLNDRDIGRTIGTEFLRSGLTRCAVYCPEGHFPFRERARGFREGVLETGAPCPLLLNLKAAVKWVRGSENPSAVMAVNDVHARELVDSCQEEGLPVPARLSVIGIDDDDVYVHLGRLTLSSMHLPFREMGRQAVRDLCRDTPHPPELREFEGSGIVHRGTTLVPQGLPLSGRKYLQYLRQTRPLPASVGQVCMELGLKRRSLELVLRKELNCTPRDLLMEERRRVSQIAQSRGWSMQDAAQEMGYRQGRSARRIYP